MAKQSGLGDQLWLDGYDVGGDIGALSRIGGGHAVQDVTPITKAAFERIGLLRDGGLEFNAFFNPATDAAHEVLSPLPVVDRILTYGRGAGLGRPAACIVAKQGNYDPTRGNDGALTIGVAAQANGFGLEWGEQLTPGIRTDGSASNGDSFDGGAASAFGLQAYLHVFAFTGTSVTVKLQQSSDDGAGDAWADVAGGGFVAATARGSQRIQTARDLAVERYLRVVTTGTFSDAQFLVVVTRNPVEVRF